MYKYSFVTTADNIHNIMVRIKQWRLFTNILGALSIFNWPPPPGSDSTVIVYVHYKNGPNLF